MFHVVMAGVVKGLVDDERVCVCVDVGGGRGESAGKNTRELSLRFEHACLL